MAKFYGNVGYIETVEEEPGVWVPKETVRSYYGDVVKNSSKFQISDSVNDDVVISNEISIVADPYAFKNFYSMRYVEFENIKGVKWKINSVEVKRPRLILSIGGVYNGDSNTTSE